MDCDPRFWREVIATMLPYTTKATNPSANKTSMRGMRTFSPLQMG